MERELLTIPQAAALLEVDTNTMRRWVDEGTVPYIVLPSGIRRIPRTPLLASLGGNYDLAGGTAKQDEGRPDVTE
jgi:excisionase family DNA binding protein